MEPSSAIFSLIIITICISSCFSEINTNPVEINTPFLMRSAYDSDCYLAIGNSVSGTHSLNDGEINIFFDCEQGGHYWLYQYDTPYCACSNWMLYSDSFGTYAQVQWDWNINDGYHINYDQCNLKLDTGTTQYTNDQRFYFDINMNALYTYNNYAYSPERLCVLQHNIGTNDLYNKWISSIQTVQVYGYEARIDCSANATPSNFEILLTSISTTAAPSRDAITAGPTSDLTTDSTILSTMNPLNPLTKSTFHPSLQPTRDKREGEVKDIANTLFTNPTQYVVDMDIKRKCSFCTKFNVFAIVIASCVLCLLIMMVYRYKMGKANDEINTVKDAVVPDNILAVQSVSGNKCSGYLADDSIVMDDIVNVMMITPGSFHVNEEDDNENANDDGIVRMVTPRNLNVNKMEQGEMLNDDEDIVLDNWEGTARNSDHENYDIAEDEFVIVEDGEENHNTRGNAEY